MTDWAKDFRGSYRRGEFALWAGAGLVVLAVHIGAVAWALSRADMTPANSPPPAVKMELAPTPEAVQTEDTNVASDQTVSENFTPSSEMTPEVPPDPVPPDTQEVTDEVSPEQAAEVTPDEAENVPDPVREQVTAENAEVSLPAARPRSNKKKVVQKKTAKKVDKPSERKPSPASKQTDQAKARVTASTRNAASMSASGDGSSTSPADWKSMLMARLERFKRYPAGARARGDSGVAYVRFKVDTSGNVLSASLARSSGFPELDAEVVALVHRASPLPPPPPGINRTMTAPVRFSVR